MKVIKSIIDKFGYKSCEPLMSDMTCFKQFIILQKVV